MHMGAPAEQLWAMLDDMADSDPEGYRAFIRRQLQEGADFCTRPEPKYCLRTRILEPEERVLYINVCSWKRVPRPDSPAHAVPVCGGRLETVSDGLETYYLLDVAFNPEVLHGEQEEGRRARLARLAVDFAQQQHGLQVSQGCSVTETNLMGSMWGLHERLASSRRPVAPVLSTWEALEKAKSRMRAVADERLISSAWCKSCTATGRVPTGASLLQQISSLRSRADDPPVVLPPLEQPGPQTPPLIQVISSTETAWPHKPEYELTLSEGPAASVRLNVLLPGVRSVSQCQLMASQDDILLQVQDLYRLHLELPAAVREEETTAIFNRKRETLSVSLPLL
uniref:PIH1 domain-containing protein 2 n=1 Tax=Paramormyrops kingsleyae TaxID=1676925 RepID=A0A3B3RQ90_9TELE|nr:PIH1 domain-containing protein 2 isoform X1 [Paramormyrops kingsleyae]XP_023681763.1 PIH1 domain-containing protein 2 isoform X1 [Paramormyrops kingsleyae]